MKHIQSEFDGVSFLIIMRNLLNINGKEMRVEKNKIKHKEMVLYAMGFFVSLRPKMFPSGRISIPELQLKYV